MKRGTKEWGDRMKCAVADGFGVCITKNIVCVRNASGKPNKHGNRSCYLEIGDTRTGKSIEIYISAQGMKVVEVLK